MNEEKHLFHLQSDWIGNSDGNGTLTTNWGQIEYGVPADLTGKPGRSNPEELLTASLVSCYSITLALLAEKKRLPLTRIEMAATGIVIRQPDRLLKFTAVELRPRLHLAGGNEAQIKIAEDIAHKAEVYCLVSRALRGNVEISVMPEIIIE